jgi:hypothetical protein
MTDNEQHSQKAPDEHEETMKDLDVPDEKAEDVKGGLGGRYSPAEKK